MPTLQLTYFPARSVHDLDAFFAADVRSEFHLQLVEKDSEGEMTEVTPTLATHFEQARLKGGR